ncbi:MAG TPA: zinc ABC transporter substrate-binding protein, partial [Candidatus Nitrosotenuis sp.]|nr:zinc ABC transporter substrate-binding protein [Candidatus Nitrosotenuis sp.]
RYGLKTFPLSGMSPESEATAADLKDFVDFIKNNKIKTIYSEEMVDPKLANTLAEEAGAQVLIFSPIEGLTSQETLDGITYLDKMNENVQNLRIGLECQ